MSMFSDQVAMSILSSYQRNGGGLPLFDMA